VENEEFINPIDIDKVAQNPGLLPYAHTLSSGVIKPDDMGKVKSNALLAMEQQTDMQLRQIQEQIELLYKQAQDIKARTDISVWIYQAQMGFNPLVGHVYHLYEKEDNKHFLSMVSPTEWGRSRAFKRFVATVKLLADHTWDIIKSENA
jgi:23S rRNA maturation mini-RNase III